MTAHIILVNRHLPKSKTQDSYFFSRILAFLKTSSRFLRVSEESTRRSRWLSFNDQLSSPAVLVDTNQTLQRIAFHRHFRYFMPTRLKHTRQRVLLSNDYRTNQIRGLLCDKTCSLRLVNTIVRALHLRGKLLLIFGIKILQVS